MRASDAVIVVPGIMGSELMGPDGEVVWGLDAASLGRAWMSGRVDALAVTPADLEGKPRLRATRLLRVPAWAPFLRGVEPYGGLLRHLRVTCQDPRAVAEFPYDWRLPIDSHRQDFIDACAAHLQAWRKVVTAGNSGSDPGAVQLVIVAHSMGGLLARHALRASGLFELTRVVVTLGTPYYGSLNAMQILATGRGGPPIPELAARKLARTCPGVYDLLPTYACVIDHGHHRRLTAEDVATLGGDVELTRQAQARWADLGLDGNGDGDGDAVWPPLVPVVGCDQPTWASVRLGGGDFELNQTHDGTNDWGDTTVWRRAGAPAGAVALPIAQSHGSLAKSGEPMHVIDDKLLRRDSGPPMGTRPLGLDVPASVTAGREVTLIVTEQPDGPGARPGDPTGLVVASTRLDTGQVTTWPPGRAQKDRVAVTNTGLQPGLHRIEVTGGGSSPVSQIVLAVAPE